ncbi:MAG: C40 family peptidase [Alicyclobacillus macrosporangiidus]|uniref:C40 family peptidase n=1 Tax=Alicyclobacillus macrosporangiidus TaxID=392015 RepID=UPI0026EAA7C2|nr:NlpC/P60 family protein [Alicyclobacillus macrosporangiidus]MCL6597184.1 C40 family peptidase [Alicyclobacillus macrosporangiidus]
MKTRFKVMTSGLVGAAAVLIGATEAWHHLRQPAETQSSDSNVSIRLVSSTPVASLQQNPQQIQRQNEVYAAVQQMLQAPATASMDASGFVQSVYAKVGVQLPRTIAEQAQTGTLINRSTDLARGDLVFFDLDNSNNAATFDGIYLGGNQFAALTTHGLKVIHLNDPYWSGKFLYGRRVL